LAFLSTTKGGTRGARLQAVTPHSNKRGSSLPSRALLDQAETDGLVTIGANEFSTRFVGQLATVELPQVGRWLSQGEKAWTLVSRRGRRLPQVMPVNGEVVAVNYELIKEPDLLSRSPTHLGWCLQVRPERLEENINNLLSSNLANEWMESLKSLVRLRVNSVLERSRLMAVSGRRILVTV